MNKKGQALIEFVLIVPIFCFMILTVIDISKILYFSSSMENKMTDVVSMYESDTGYESIQKNINRDIKKVSLNINEDEEFVEFILTKDVSVITPGLNLIFSNPHQIEIKRVIYNV